MNKLVFVGEFPVELGGITRKSNYLYEEIRKYHDTTLININVSNFERLSLLRALVKIAILLPFSKGIMLCVDSYLSNIIIRFLDSFCPQGIKKTIMVLSGTIRPEDMNEGKYVSVEFLNKYFSVWAETESMKDNLFDKGVNNVVLYPNPRPMEVSKSPSEFSEGDSLRLLYYSLISKEKGVIDVIQAINELNRRGRVNFTIDFYGRVLDDVEEHFYQFINKTDNAKYCGINDATDIEEYYSVLNGYDIFLFPTQWRGEGIAGVCVEAKAAGMAIIASDHNVNKEVVKEELDEGVIIPVGDIEKLVETIEKLYNNPNRLNKIKLSSYNSRKRYSIDSYKSLFLDCFKQYNEN